MAVLKMHGGENNNAQVIEKYLEDGIPVFYVRPFSKELKEELDRLIKDAPRVARDTSVTERNGTYRVARVNSEPIKNIQEFMGCLWGMLFRRFMAEAKHVCIDETTSEKYYVVIFSNEYIEPCGRKLAV